jgi:hypothetical protein
MLAPTRQERYIIEQVFGEMYPSEAQLRDMIDTIPKVTFTLKLHQTTLGTGLLRRLNLSHAKSHRWSAWEFQGTIICFFSLSGSWDRGSRLVD